MASKTQRLYKLQQQMWNTKDDLQQGLQRAIEGAGNIRDQYQETLDDMGNGSIEIEERISAINDWIEKLESADTDISLMSSLEELQKDEPEMTEEDYEIWEQEELEKFAEALDDLSV